MTYETSFHWLHWIMVYSKCMPNIVAKTIAIYVVHRRFFESQFTSHNNSLILVWVRWWKVIDTKRFYGKKLKYQNFLWRRYFQLDLCDFALRNVHFGVWYTEFASSITTKFKFLHRLHRSALIVCFYGCVPNSLLMTSQMALVSILTFVRSKSKRHERQSLVLSKRDSLANAIHKKSVIRQTLKQKKGHTTTVFGVNHSHTHCLLHTTNITPRAFQ